MARGLKFEDSNVPDQMPATGVMGGGLGAVGVSPPQATRARIKAISAMRFMAPFMDRRPSTENLSHELICHARMSG
jgi:hypothetical protein